MKLCKVKRDDGHKRLLTKSRNSSRTTVLKGWRLKLFNLLLEKKWIVIKNHKLKVTDKFMKIVNREMKKRKD